jgi:hypothetical protein
MTKLLKFRLGSFATKVKETMKSNKKKHNNAKEELENDNSKSRNSPKSKSKEDVRTDDVEERLENLFEQYFVLYSKTQSLRKQSSDQMKEVRDRHFHFDVFRNLQRK